MYMDSHILACVLVNNQSSLKVDGKNVKVIFLTSRLIFSLFSY